MNASAQIVTEGLCDAQSASQAVKGPNGTSVQVTSCRQPLLNLIANEKVGIDVAFWFMEDTRYSDALITWHKNNPKLPIRVLVDERANNTEAHGAYNSTVLTALKNAGIPMREKIPDTSFNIQILHFKMMLFHGQNVVEFSKANYSPTEFVPIDSTDFNDEAIFFTNDNRITNSFRKRFDDMWINTSAFKDYANIVDPPQRQYDSTLKIDPSMNFPGENDTTKDFQVRAKSRFDAETLGIDAMVFRITDSLLPTAIITAAERGVAVRIITDDSEYNNPGRLWDAAHVDRMYMEGLKSGKNLKIKIGDRGTNPGYRQRPNMTAHDGLSHEALVILHNLGEVIFGSSNWTTPSAYKQDEHNFFYNPSLGKQWFFDWFDDQFNRKWNDSVNFPDFTPLPPGTPTYAAPTSGATGVATTSVTLQWDGGPWGHFYDIYFGTTSTPPLLVNNQKIAYDTKGNPTPQKFTISNLQPGTTYYWRIVSRTFAQMTKTGPTWNFTTAGSSGGGGGGSTPFNGTPAAIPGTFQAENFDVGAQGVAYNDTTPTTNSGGAYRQTGVDIELTTDSGGGYDVGWTKAGEWLNYTVNIATTGTYTFSARVANTGSGGNFHVLVDNVDKGTISVPNTGGWQAWQTVTQTGVSLTSGQHVIRILFSTAGTSGGVGNFNWFSFDSSSSPPATSSTPFNGTPSAIPGMFQAENFDDGGQGVAYNDTTPTTNSGGAYRQTGVDIEPTTDTLGGVYDVGWTKAGEWLNYTVNIATTGTYTFSARVANTGSGGNFHVLVDGVDKGTIAVPNTGGWQAWQTVTQTGVSLTSGQHVVRILFATTGTSGGVGNFNWFQLTSP